MVPEVLFCDHIHSLVRLWQVRTGSLQVASQLSHDTVTSRDATLLMLLAIATIACVAALAALLLSHDFGTLWKGWLIIFGSSRYCTRVHFFKLLLLLFLCFVRLQLLAWVIVLVRLDARLAYLAQIVLKVSLRVHLGYQVGVFNLGLFQGLKLGYGRANHFWLHHRSHLAYNAVFLGIVDDASETLWV